MTWDEIKHLNPREMGLWPMAARIGVVALLFALALLLFWWFTWSEQLDTLELKRNQEAALKQEYVNKKGQAINLDLYTQQLKDVENQLAVVVSQLPSKSEMDALLANINHVGIGRGLQFELFKPQPEKVQDFYAELPIDIKVTGTYHAIGGFVNDLAKLSRIVTLSNISILPQAPPNGPINRAGAKDTVLTMEATARTFRHLDEDELEAIQRAKDAAKVKK